MQSQCCLLQWKESDEVRNKRFCDLCGIEGVLYETITPKYGNNWCKRCLVEVEKDEKVC